MRPMLITVALLCCVCAGKKKTTLRDAFIQKNMADNSVLPGIVGFEWLWLYEAFCSSVWTVE